MPFTKGKVGNPNGRPVGAKGKLTILKEERRAIFDDEVAQMFREKIREARPEYLLDQFMGKAPDKLDITTKDNAIGLPMTDELIELARQELKKRKLNG